MNLIYIINFWYERIKVKCTRGTINVTWRLPYELNTSVIKESLYRDNYEILHFVRDGWLEFKLYLELNIILYFMTDVLLNRLS